LIQGAAQGFAIHCDDFSRDRFAQALGPPQETVEKMLRIQRRKDSVERVVRRDAVWQFQKCFEPIVLGVSELFHVVEALAAADKRTDADDKNVEQFVALGAINPRVGHILKAVEQTDHGNRLRRLL